MERNKRSLIIITVFIILLGLVTSLMGLFYTKGGEAYSFINQYGDSVQIYGEGLYANDSSFMAPIYRGSDLTMLILAIPMLIIALLLDLKHKSLKSRLFLTSVIAVFTYYSASNALGIIYNILHLIYIAFFSLSLFGLITAIVSIDKIELAKRMTGKLPYKGFYVFLGLSGVVLIVAWLPDIISSLSTGRPLALIENYTTSITNVLDMGIIGPVAFISMYLVKRRNGMGFILLGIMFTVCVVIGAMLPMQTIFQLEAGIDIPIPVLVTKVASFVILALFALYFDIRLFRAYKN